MKNDKNIINDQNHPIFDEELYNVEGLTSHIAIKQITVYVLLKHWKGFLTCMHIKHNSMGTKETKKL